MPTSKKRAHHHQHTAHTHAASGHHKKHTKLLTAVIIFFALIGLGIAFFAAGAVIVWLLLGTALGAGLGYLVGKQGERTFK